jgi:uncharacterized delta-60 repeat protein
VRYNINGSLDYSFGTGGIVTTSLGTYFQSGGMSVITQADEKILVFGSSLLNFFVLMRYNNNGTLDTSFDTDGIVTTSVDFFEQAQSAVLQTDGKILVAGITRDNTIYQEGTPHVTLIRYNNNGSLDTHFGTNGIVISLAASVNTSDIEDGYAKCSVVLQTDGKILLETPGNFGLYLIRYNSDGSLDTAFGKDGVVITQISSVSLGSSITLQADGKILVAGTSYSDSGNNWAADFALMRYNTDGSLDSTFNGSINGTTTNDLLKGDNQDNVINGLAGNDTLNGYAGKDILHGGTNKDQIGGGTGNDVLNGGGGNDTLTGGIGKDTFVFNTALSVTGIDNITDFNPAYDTIRLENSIFTKLTTTGVLPVDNFVTASAAHDSNDYMVYNQTTGALFYDADGNGTGAAVQIAIIGNLAALTSADFVVI